MAGGPAARSSSLHADAAPFEPARFSVEKYHALIASGAFAEDDAVELLEGIVVPKTPKNSPHELSNRKSDRALSAVVPAEWCVWNQAAVTFDDSEPEPDLSIARGLLDDSRARRPSGIELGLVAEVTDTSLANDRRKARVYARAGVLVYWIINLRERCVEVHDGPESDTTLARDRNRTIYEEHDSIPLVLDGVEVARIAVAQLLP